MRKEDRITTFPCDWRSPFKGESKLHTKTKSLCIAILQTVAADDKNLNEFRPVSLTSCLLAYGVQRTQLLFHNLLRNRQQLSDVSTTTATISCGVTPSLTQSYCRVVTKRNHSSLSHFCLITIPTYL